MLNATKPNSVLNVHVVGESSMSGGIPQITLPHTLASGPVKNEDYGLDLARRFLPERVVKNSEQVWKFLRDRNASKSTGPATKAMKQNKLILALPDLLKQALNSSMDDSALASYLKKLQTEFTLRMNMTAEEDKQKRGNGETRNHRIDHPVLEKPNEKELQEWKKKCDAAERRVMHANMAHSQNKKHPTPGEESTGYQHKRIKANDDAASMSRRPTPINRGSMIEELRRDACTPTTTTEDTPSSFTMDIPESYAGSEPAMSVEMTSPQITAGEFPADALDREQRQRAVSISSDSSMGYDNTLDDNVNTSGNFTQILDERNREFHGEPTPQPLQSFQPLKAWYARSSEPGGVSEGEPELGPEYTRASAGSTSARSMSATQEFLGGLEESEEE